MTRYIVTILLAAGITAALCLSPGCSKTPPPTTCLSALPDTALVGQRITFASCTSGASSFYWLFGDGGFATTASTTHTYTAPGDYHGSLTTSNGTGSTLPFRIVVIRPASVWTFQGLSDTSYSALAVGDTIQTSTFSAAQLTHVSTLLLVFDSLPATSGSYQVVNDQFATPQGAQVSVYLSTAAGRFYGSTGRDHSSAQITVSGGEVKVVLPSVMMVNLSLPSDSAQLSATVTQTQ